MIGTPYFPATANGAVCPACHAIVKDTGRHWIDAGHSESDVTKQSMDEAFEIAGAA